MERRIIGIVSGKGGVGKTTTTVNVSAALMELKKNVVAIDSDIKMSGLGLQLGMYYFPFTLNDVLMNRGKLFEALYIHPSGLRIIPASLYIENVGLHRLKTVLEDPFLDNNIVLIDAPPGLENNTLCILKACPEIVIVTTPEIPSITDAMKTILMARKTKNKILGIIINMHKKRDSNQISVKEIESSCGLPVIGIVPLDGNIKKSLFKRTPAVFLNSYSPATIAYKKIAASLVGETYTPPKNLFLKTIFGRFKK